MKKKNKEDFMEFFVFPFPVSYDIRRGHLDGGPKQFRIVRRYKGSLEQRVMSISSSGHT